MNNMFKLIYKYLITICIFFNSWDVIRHYDFIRNTRYSPIYFINYLVISYRFFKILSRKEKVVLILPINYESGGMHVRF